VGVVDPAYTTSNWPIVFPSLGTTTVQTCKLVDLTV